MQYDYHPVCDVSCQGANIAAAAVCSGTEQLVFVAQRPVASVVRTQQPVPPAGTWVLQAVPECLTPAQQLPFDPAQLQTTIDDYFQRIPLPTPGLHVSPADNAVVNLPEIVSADPPGASTFTVDIAPFPTVTISAAVRWEWDFGDGGRLSTETPGRAYDGSDAASGHYVTHTYRKASPGWPLSVTSVWSASYTVAGMPGTYGVNGAVRRISARTLPAADYGSTLTGN